MDLYSIFLFLHIASAIVWIGAGFGLVILGIAAQRANDEAASMAIVRNVVFMAPRVFMPSSIATLIFGLINAFTTWGFGLLWIWIGLAGFAATFVTGNFFLKPRAEEVDKATQAGNHARALQVGNELLTLAKFDYTMLFVVVADMVFKPQLSSWLVLLVMVVVLVVAGYLFLLPVLRKPVPATA